MPHEPSRKPFALANWKMAMTLGESLDFAQRFVPQVATVHPSMDIVICPPYTALHAMSRALTHTGIQLGAQNVCAASGPSHTGEISPPLVADTGCTWVMLGHWEVRRRHGESDLDVNQKMAALPQWGLRPIILLGEASHERDRMREALGVRLPPLFQGIGPQQAASAVLLYEPEWAVGGEDPAPFHRIASACEFLRRWMAGAYNTETAEAVRIIYGGSVSPARSQELLASPHVDGLGAGRKGRDPDAFAEIVRRIASEKGLPG